MKIADQRIPRPKPEDFFVMFFVPFLLVLLGAPQVPRRIAADPLLAVYGRGKRLQQQDAGPSFAISSPTPSMFGLSGSGAISNLGSWTNNPALVFTCIGPDDQPYDVGPDNPELCVEQVEVTMFGNELFGNVTVVFDDDQLSELRSINPVAPSLYVWGLPLSKFAVPNAYYEGLLVNATFGGGGWIAKSLDGSIYNFFNASASSLREYYGVDPNLQGSDKTVQGSTMTFGAPASVNTTASNEYLELQGLVPNVPLQIPNWAPLNNVSACPFTISDACGETQLDVEAQQAFAPQAVTFYAPSEFLPDSFIIEGARSTGYTEDEIQQLLVKYDAVKTGAGSPDELFSEPAAGAAIEAYFEELVSNVTSSEERAQVVSLSWTFGYPLLANSFEVFESGLKNLTLSGITILVSSGDSGASGSYNATPTTCLSGINPLVANQQEGENGVWPAVSPWVTAVGGTQFLATADNPQAEVVCSSRTGGGITSGGGFAGSDFPQDLYSMPSWQKTAVERYLAENNQSTFAAFPTADTPGWNPTGRAFPDIAAYGAWFPVIDWSGRLTPTSGTSLSAPMVAALFSLANQALKRDGYDFIGYANPMLYWMGENCTDSFNDVTIGDNQAGENDNGELCSFGFPAAPGWDAATGLGSINFGPFVECAKRYQDEVRNKGLEILPDGSYRGLPPNGSNPTQPPTSGQLTVSASTVVLAFLSFLAI